MSKEVLKGEKMKQEHDRIYLAEARIENFKKLKLVELRPTPEGVVEVIGDNAEGKTSIVDALVSLFTGAAADPSEPIRQGEKYAEISAVLGPDPVTLKKSWKRGGNPKLEIKLADGSPPRGGAVTWLKSICTTANFDPSTCISDPKATRAALLKIADLKPDWDSFPGGRPFDADAPDADPLAVIQSESAKLDEKRLAAQREKKRLEQVKNTLEKEVPVEARKAKPVDLGGLLKERDAIQAEHKAFDNHERLRTDQIARIERQRSHVAEIQKRLKEAEEEYELLEVGLTEIVKSKPPTPRQTADVDARIAGIQEQNRLAARAEQFRQAEKDWKAAWIAEDDCADTIKDIQEFTAGVLGSATLPVPGLALTFDTVTLNGIDFAESSMSERARVAFVILNHLNPRLRLACFDQAEMFGAAARREIYAMAKEFDFLAILFTVGEDSDLPNAIVLEDGGAL